MPCLTPVSWIFQTLAIFFLVGGYSAARSYRGDYWPGWASAWSGWPARWRCWPRSGCRSRRPVLAGVPGRPCTPCCTLVLDPLWFLGVFAGLTALTPLAVALVRRLGALGGSASRCAWWPGSTRSGSASAGPSWVGWLNVGAGWLVPYLLGIAWARGSFRGREVPALMLAGGVAATAALVLWAGYPASMVGVNGAAHLQPEPAHARRGDLRHRPGRPGAAAAGPRWPG